MGVDWTSYLAITVLAGGGSMVFRSVFIMAAGKREFPEKLMRALSFVPVAVFAALVTYSLHLERLLTPGDPAPIRILALAIAAFVAVKTKSMLYTILSGMGAMWLISWIVTLL